jgi:hypothetical protein
MQRKGAIFESRIVLENGNLKSIDVIDTTHVLRNIGLVED